MRIRARINKELDAQQKEEVNIMAVYTVMGKTHVGHTHAENQDRILKRCIVTPHDQEDIYLLGVVDGISGARHGGSVAKWLVEQHLEVDEIFDLDSSESVFEQFHSYLLELREKFRAEFAKIPDMLESGAALCIACLQGDRGVCFWLGDSPAFLTQAKGKKKTTLQLTTPDYDRITGSLTDWFGDRPPFNIKRNEFAMSSGDILTVTSDGAQCDEYVLSDLYKREPFMPVTLQGVIKAALRYPRSDDVSIVAAQMR